MTVPSLGVSECPHNSKASADLNTEQPWCRGGGTAELFINNFYGQGARIHSWNLGEFSESICFYKTYMNVFSLVVYLNPYFRV